MIEDVLVNPEHCRRVDELVYRLYGLAEEDTQIVGDSLNV